MTNRKTWVLGALMTATLGAGSTWAAPETVDVASELSTLKNRIAELEKQENENWLNTQRTEQIKAIVHDVLADAKARGQYLDGDLQAGYKNGFFIQSADHANKLVVGGFLQARYVYEQSDVKNRSKFSSSPVASSDPANASGFEIRRARVSFSGNVMSPDLTFKFEGDFGGGSSNSGNFQVTDAFIAYKVAPALQFKTGSFKVPFAKAELTSDTGIGLMERNEALYAFDPVRALGLSVYGDIVDSVWTYDVNVNDGSKSNTGGRIDDTSGSLDNRLGFYARTQYAGNGKVSDFADESDLAYNDNFVWMLGGAVGYESQNNSTNAYPAKQGYNLSGLSTADSPGFMGNVPLNGDLYRATIDWSAKWQGWSFNTAGYYQQANFNPGTGVTLPYTNDSSFGMFGYYGQLGYFILPKKLEVVTRYSQMMTEGYPNDMQAYSLGLNYYIFGNNLKVQSDVTYIPSEAAYSDSGQDTVRNTQDLIARIQLQVKF